jgi:hypothetical protein
VVRHLKFTNEALAVLALVNREASCFFFWCHPYPLMDSLQVPSITPLFHDGK